MPLLSSVNKRDMPHYKIDTTTHPVFPDLKVVLKVPDLQAKKGTLPKTRMIGDELTNHFLPSQSVIKTVYQTGKQGELVSSRQQT